MWYDRRVDAQITDRLREVGQKVASFPEERIVREYVSLIDRVLDEIEQIPSADRSAIAWSSLALIGELRADLEDSLKHPLEVRKGLLDQSFSVFSKRMIEAVRIGNLTHSEIVNSMEEAIRRSGRKDPEA